jgi:SAM-dependent methyltransferase
MTTTSPLKETPADLEKHDEAFQDICSGLIYQPGSIFRIASQYLANWGIRVTDGNASQIEIWAALSYFNEWERGTTESNDAIGRATKNAKLAHGNEDLNYDVGLKVAELLVRMAKYKDKIDICDIGAGAGDTTTAALTFLDLADPTGDVLRKCHFYLLEPSHDRLGNAKKAIENHIIKEKGKVNFSLVTSSQGRHFRMLADGAFDLVMSSAVFHHMTFMTHLSEIRRKMAEDGVLVLGDWYTAIWKHPAFVANLLDKLGMPETDLGRFMYMFGVKKGDLEGLEKKLEPYRRESNRMMVDYEVEIAKQFQRIPPASRLYFLEGHETLEDRVLKLERCGFETDKEELRAKHRAFVTMDGNIKNLFPKSDFATVIATGKIQGHTPRADVSEIKQRIRREIMAVA